MYHKDVHTTRLRLNDFNNTVDVCLRCELRERT